MKKRTIRKIYGIAAAGFIIGLLSLLAVFPLSIVELAGLIPFCTAARAAVALTAVGIVIGGPSAAVCWKLANRF